MKDLKTLEIFMKNLFLRNFNCNCFKVKKVFEHYVELKSGILDHLLPFVTKLLC